MYTLYSDKNNIFECDIQLEGASLSQAFARVIVEIGLEELNPEPSFGSHFFQNVTSLRIGYFTINKTDDDTNIDLDWLKDFEKKCGREYVRLTKVPNKL